MTTAKDWLAICASLDGDDGGGERRRLALSALADWLEERGEDPAGLRLLAARELEPVTWAGGQCGWRELQQHEAGHRLGAVRGEVWRRLVGGDISHRGPEMMPWRLYESPSRAYLALAAALCATAE